MPDSLGRFYLSEMQDQVRRAMNDAQLTVNTSTGAETAAPILPTQLYSTIDIDNALNSTMTETFLEMSTDHEDLFAQTTYISVAVNRIGPYALPFNLVKVRWLKWKSPSFTLQSVRPSDWQPMVYYDEDLSAGQNYDFTGGQAPTYRFEGQNIILNQLPDQNNTNGVMVNSVVLPPLLVNAKDVVQSQFARLLQDFMIYDVAVHLGETRESQSSEELKTKRGRAHTLLMVAVDNALQPPTVQLFSSRLVKNTYSGRRSG